MDSLPAIENVVRMIFPLTMIREGELLPAAFKLREQEDGAEKYLSVFRQYHEKFCYDIVDFDKQRNLPCCIMNVGEVNTVELTIANNAVKFIINAVPTPTYASHAGIFVSIGGIPLEGRGTVAFETLRIGKEANYHLIAIRRRLVEIARKRMTSVSQLLDYGKSR